ncbi:hypothetical protein DsansV1_C02g0014141 [Dioscorea sansibarensis]
MESPVLKFRTEEEEDYRNESHFLKLTKQHLVAFKEELGPSISRNVTLVNNLTLNERRSEEMQPAVGTAVETNPQEFLEEK